MKKRLNVVVIMVILLFGVNVFKRRKKKEIFLVENGRLSSYLGLDKEIVIPSDVRTIGMRAFEQCESIEKVKIGGNVEKIEEAAFEDCINLKTVIITAPVKKIGKWAFCGCTSLEKLVLPKSLEYIEDLELSKCKKLKKIQFR